MSVCICICLQKYVFIVQTWENIDNFLDSNWKIRGGGSNTAHNLFS